MKRPRGRGRTSRIDFVCLGRGLPCSELASWVALDLDLLATNEDHYAVAVSGCFWLKVWDGNPGHLWRRQYNVTKLGSPKAKAILRSELEAVGPVPWRTEVNEHAAYLEQISHEILDRHFAIKANGPRSSYISDAVWQLREHRNRLKARTRFWKEGRGVALLKAGFARLAGRSCNLKWHKIGLLYDLFAAAIKFSTGRIKSCISADKQHLLQHIVQASANGSMQQIQKAIKRCGLGRRVKNQSGRPAPLLLDSEGRPVSNREALDDHWLQHFGQMEAGERISFQEFASIVAAPRNLPEVTIDLRILPTFQEVERQFQQVRCGAASGLDGLPPELFKAAPQLLARLFHPLMVKSSLCLAQPVQWRGGVLFEAYKNSGSPSLSDSYRSLFVSSVPGKCFHRILRNKASTVIEAVLDPLHCGGRKQRCQPLRLICW